jgi:esterase/lipase
VATWLAPRLGTRDVSVALYERSAHVLAWDSERDQVAREILGHLSRIA